MADNPPVAPQTETVGQLTAPPQMPASGFNIQAPYAAGSPDPIYVGGDADAGGRDDVAGSVAGAQASAEARFHEHQTDTYAQGSQIGDTVSLPLLSTTGLGDGGFYDPPRDYGGDQGPPDYGGDTDEGKGI